MILKPTFSSLKNIGYYLGRLIIGIGLSMVLPIILGLCLGEFNAVLDFIISLELSLIVGLFIISLCKAKAELNWSEGLVVVSLAWIAAMFLGAIPLYLSGHFFSFLDACFDAMSGFATTGLTLIQDLDHLSYTHNLWRHLIMFIGGQGIVILAISFFVRGVSGSIKLYLGEAREEKILPNIISTARFIWLVSLTYLILGTLTLGICGLCIGMKPFEAFFHGLCIFMTAFDTGGFAPKSLGIMYYQSPVYEFLTLIIMLLGAFNFKLHYSLWTGNLRQIYKDIETVAFFISCVLCFFLCGLGLSEAGIYSDVLTFFRKSAYILISAHTGCGYQNIYAQEFLNYWREISLIGVILAMGLGGAVCSTTGAIKMLRIGVAFKALKQDIKKFILPSRAIFSEKFYHFREIFLEDRLVRSSLSIIIWYLALYFLGALVGILCGYPILASLFESVSAAANVGLSCGLTNPAMPTVLKIVYILQMWIGRLEFVAIFGLFGFFISFLKGK